MTLSREDDAVIDALVRHNRCPQSEAAEMREMAESDPEVMAYYRRLSANIANPRPRPRTSEAYVIAMQQMEQIGVKRRRA